MADEAATYRYAIVDVVTLLKSRWAPAVLTALAAGPLRYSDLLAEIHNAEARSGRAGHARPLTEKVLTDTLRSLEKARLVANHRQTATFGSSSWYELTVHGKTLLRALRPAVEWVTEYRRALAADNKPG